MLHLIRISAFALLASSASLSASAAEPVIDVSPVKSEQGDVMRVRASIRIDAPAARIWAVLTDCKGAPRIIPHLESCRIIGSDPAGRWDTREHVISPPLLPKMRTIVRNDFTAPRRLEFRLLSGDMKASDGAWTLTPDGDKTLLSYDALVAPNFSAPQFIVSRSIRNDFPQMLRAIERASVARAP